MVKRIFSSILLVSSSVLLVGLIFIIGILYQHYRGQLEKELQNEAAYLSVAVKHKGQRLSKTAGRRGTNYTD